VRRLWSVARSALGWIAALFGRRRRTPEGAAGALQPAPLCFRVELVDEQPDLLSRDRCYLVGEGEHRWFAAFSCPCGCTAPVVLNLLPGMRPRWRVEVHPDETVSISPSIARHVGCESHFFIRRGRVEWYIPREPG
jgi:hypothetical protein